MSKSVRIGVGSREYMSFTYDPATNIGRVRRTLPDKDINDYFWDDEDIESFLVDEDGWRRATALALETMASDHAMVMQVIKVQNLQTDGASVARVLLNRAAALRAQAVDAESTDDGGFDIIEMVGDDFQFRERMFKQAIRGEA